MSVDKPIPGELVKAVSDLVDAVNAGSSVDLSNYSGAQVHLTATDITEGAGIKLKADGLGQFVMDNDVGGLLEVSELGQPLTLVSDNGNVEIVSNIDSGRVRIRSDHSGGQVVIEAEGDSGTITVEAAGTGGTVNIQAGSSDADGGNLKINVTALGQASLFAGQLVTLASDTAVLLDAPAAGFFGHTPVAQPSGVPVTAAGIHAALVALGLITA